MAKTLTKPQIEYVDLKQVDTAVQTMIQNDKLFLSQSTIAPKVWTCRWYNVVLTDSNKSEYLYKKGDAVWVNTENVESFVESHYTYILNVIKNNSYLWQQYVQIADNDSKVLEFMQNVATGKISGSSYGLPLYYFGDIAKKTQIRVSTCDENDTLPTNDECWEDFFTSSNTEIFQQQLLDRAKEVVSEALTKHLEQYHLSGIEQYWHEKYGTSTSLSDIYLQQSMSNLSGLQEYTGVDGKIDSGFDYVLYYSQKRFSSKCWKWFRVWNSGLLEHGGIVSPSIADDLGDELVYEECSENPIMYKVNLNWSNGGVVAPIYKYATSSTGFYFDSVQIDVGNGCQIDMSNVGRQLDQDSHYVVQITPIADSNVPYQILHPISSGSNQFYYMSKDVNCMTNSSFQFVVNTECDFYSYHVTGFSRNIQWSFK